MRPAAVALAALLVLAASTSSAAPAGRPVRFTTWDGVTLRGFLYGHGTRAVVLAHMWPDGQRNWARGAPDLASRGYLVLTFDFRGFGRSDGRPVVAHTGRDVLGAAAFVRRRGARRVCLVGASMGGTASIRAAAFTHVQCVVAVSSGSTFRELNARQVLPRLRTPVLFIAGSADGVFPESARLMYRLAGGPKRLVIVRSHRHGTRLFDDPRVAGRVRRELTGWLGRYLR